MILYHNQYKQLNTTNIVRKCDFKAWPKTPKIYIVYEKEALQDLSFWPSNLVK